MMMMKSSLEMEGVPRPRYLHTIYTPSPFLTGYTELHTVCVYVCACMLACTCVCAPNSAASSLEKRDVSAAGVGWQRVRYEREGSPFPETVAGACKAWSRPTRQSLKRADAVTRQGVGDCYSLVWTGGTSSVPSQLS